MGAHNIDIGNKGEDIAAEFLENNDYKIIERKYRCNKVGEIDIIARKNELIIFVEVKNRNTTQYGGAIYSINLRKKKTIRKIASYYLLTNPHINIKENIFRFDLITIDDGEIEWIKDIIR